MFSDLISRSEQSKSIFQDTVRDSFGMSVISDVYESFISEINSLFLMSEQTERVIAEVDMLIQEAASIGGAHE